MELDELGIQILQRISRSQYDLLRPTVATTSKEGRNTSTPGVVIDLPFLLNPRLSGGRNGVGSSVGYDKVRVRAFFIKAIKSEVFKISVVSSSAFAYVNDGYRDMNPNSASQPG